MIDRCAKPARRSSPTTSSSASRTPEDASLRRAIDRAGPQLLLAATLIDSDGQGEILGRPAATGCPRASAMRASARGRRRLSSGRRVRRPAPAASAGVWCTSRSRASRSPPHAAAASRRALRAGPGSTTTALRARSASTASPTSSAAPIRPPRAQDRRRRHLGAPAGRPPPHRARRRPRDVGRGDPGQRDLDAASRTVLFAASGRRRGRADRVARPPPGHCSRCRSAARLAADCSRRRGVAFSPLRSCCSPRAGSSRSCSRCWRFLWPPSACAAIRHAAAASAGLRGDPRHAPTLAGAGRSLDGTGTARAGRPAPRALVARGDDQARRFQVARERRAVVGTPAIAS